MEVSQSKGRKRGMFRPAYAIIFMICCCMAGQASAQAQLRIGKSGLHGNPGSAVFGQTVEMSYYVVNAGDEAYVGEVRSHMKVKGQGKITSTFTFPESTPFNPGDSVEMEVNTELSKQFFKKGENIIVIWPTGTKIKTIDTIWAKIELDEPQIAGVPDQYIVLGDVSVYPNPSAGRIFLNYSEGTQAPRSLEVIDVTGRMQCAFTRNELETASSAGLSIEVLPAGLYTCRLTMCDGTRRWVRVEKL